MERRNIRAREKERILVGKGDLISILMDEEEVEIEVVKDAIIKVNKSKK
jgi:hypothetical protein